MNPETNSLLLFLNDYFVICADLLQSPHREENKNFSFDLLRQTIKQSITRFEQGAHEARQDVDLIHKAKYALVAFIDELVIQKTDAVSHEWVSRPLQLEYFGENTAGERFFTYLAELRLQSERYIDALEIYYLCLELGFRGIFQKENAALLQLKNEIRNQIQQIRRYVGRSLYTKTDTAVSERHPSRPWSLSKFAIGGAFLLLMVMMGFIGTITYQAKAYRQVIVDYENKFEQHKGRI